MVKPKNKYPKGTYELKTIGDRALYITPKHFIILGGVLTPLYVFLVPIADMNYKLNRVLGEIWRSPTGESMPDNVMQFLSYFPVLLLALMLTYGLYWRARNSVKRTTRANAFGDAMAPILISVAVYTYLSLWYGMNYHYVF